MTYLCPMTCPQVGFRSPGMHSAICPFHEQWKLLQYSMLQGVICLEMICSRIADNGLYRSCSHNYPLGFHTIEIIRCHTYRTRDQAERQTSKCLSWIDPGNTPQADPQRSGEVEEHVGARRSNSVL
jgi:hypothetical protein